MHDMIPLACPMLFHLKLMWDDEGARVEVGQNIKVGVLWGHKNYVSMRPHQILTKKNVSVSSIYLLTPYMKLILGFSPIKPFQTITMW